MSLLLCLMLLLLFDILVVATVTCLVCVVSLAAVSDTHNITVVVAGVVAVTPDLAVPVSDSFT